MLGRTLRVSAGVPTEPAIMVGTVEQIRKVDTVFQPGGNLQGDAYALVSVEIKGQKAMVITGATERGTLYGTFAFLSKIARGVSVAVLHEVEKPVGQFGWFH